MQSLGHLAEVLDAKTEDVNFVPKKDLQSGLFEQSLGVVEKTVTEELGRLFAAHLSCSTASQQGADTEPGSYRHRFTSDTRLAPHQVYGISSISIFVREGVDDESILQYAPVFFKQVYHD